MKGKYYGVYDLKRSEECIGVFGSINEICNFFGGIRRHRVECAICRKNPLAFGSERYWVVVFDTITEQAGKALLNRELGRWRYKVTPDGIYTRASIVKTDWRFYAANYEEAAELCGWKGANDYGTTF